MRAHSLFVLVLPLAASGQPWTPQVSYESEIVRERDFHDAAARWDLTISPHPPKGKERQAARGEYIPATYRMVKDGALAWERELSFTMYQVEISPDGVIAGYAYETGWRGGTVMDGGGRRGDLRIAIIDADGKLQAAADRTRTDPTDLMTALPTVLGITLQGDQFNVYAEHSPARYEVWRYRLSTGEHLSDVALKWTIEEADSVGRPWFIAAIPDTPFDILVARHVVDQNNATKTPDQTGGRPIIELYGAQFMIVDTNGHAVWEWARPRMYSDHISNPADDRPPAEQDWSSLTPSVHSRAVTIPLPDGTELKYTLVQDPQDPNGWKLDETKPD